METETFDVVKNVDSLSEDKLQDMFMAAVKIVQHLPKEGPVSTSNDTKLQFYSLYKQATKGPCSVSKPAIWNVVERFKWDAWEKLGTTDKETSKKLYIGALQRQIDETFAYFGKDYFMKQPDWPKLESVLRPAFKLINRNLTEDDESMEIISGAYDKSKENLQIVIEDDVRSNDGDYTDASEHLDLAKGQFRSTDSRPLNNDVMNVLTHIMEAAKNITGDPAKDRLLTIILNEFEMDEMPDAPTNFDQIEEKLLETTTKFHPSPENKEVIVDSKKFTILPRHQDSFPELLFIGAEPIRSRHIRGASLVMALEFGCNYVLNDAIEFAVYLKDDQTLDGLLGRQIITFKSTTCASKNAMEVTLKLDEEKIEAILKQEDTEGKIHLFVERKHQNSEVTWRIDNVFLELDVVKSHKRSKRHVECSGKNNNEGGCCLKPLIIDFVKMGWSVVVAPKVVNLHYCNGQCNGLQSQTKQSYFLQKLHEMGQVQHTSCCFPTEYEPLNVSIVLPDGFTVVTKTIHDLITTKCTCY
uniref:ACB domain-containing protein n=1 Tax=Rhabditophanes sp. KR3021 TaxID=114890 RepID=A0AC35TFL6_9BILA